MFKTQHSLTSALQATLNVANGFRLVLPRDTNLRQANSYALQACKSSLTLIRLLAVDLARQTLGYIDNRESTKLA